MTGNNYRIEINDNDEFDLYVNGILTISSTFIYGLLIAIASRENIDIPKPHFAESYVFGFLLEKGLSITIPDI